MNRPFLLLALLCGCARSTGSSRIDPRGDASEDAPARAALELAPAPAGSSVPTALSLASERSHRRVLASLDAEPLLRPFSVSLREHFHAATGPFFTQHIGLAGGRDAWLVSRADGRDATVIVVDRDILAWSKPRPAAGIVPPVVQLTISPRPDGGVVLFAYVASLHLLAARMWAEDGNAYAEIELASFDACDAMAAAYKAAFGWIVVCASSSGTRAQRLREDGTTMWGPNGVAVGASSAVTLPSIAVDTPATWVLVQRARGAGADHLLAWRYDAQGLPLWAAPADVGALAPPGAKGEEDRYETITVPEGGVRIERLRLAAKATNAVLIRPDGEIQRQ